MACNYFIKLPNGGEIKIPANFEKINPNDADANSGINILKDFSTEQIAKYRADPKSSKDISDAIDTIVKILYDKTPSDFNATNLRYYVERNLEAPDKIISELNDSIEKLGTPENIEKALRTYIRRNPKLIEKHIADLSKEVTPRYFQGVNTIEVIGKSSLKTELNRIKASINENTENAFSNGINYNLKTFLEGVKGFVGVDANKLLPINTRIAENNTLNIDDFTFYQQNNNLSLFLGIFKKIAAKLSPEELKPILAKANLNTKVKFKFDLDNFDSNTFFNGKFEKDKFGNDKFIDGDFHELFNYSSMKSIIDEIISAVGNSIGDKLRNPKKKFLVNEMKYLFFHLDPSVYGKKFFTDEKIQEQFMNNEYSKEIEFRNKIRAERIALLKSGSDTEKNFSQPYVIKNNLYEQAKNNLSIGDDLIKFPSKEFKNGLWGVVTEIIPKANGVQVRGVSMNFTKQVISHEYTFSEPIPGGSIGESLTYRKYEIAPDPEDPNNPISSIDLKTSLITAPIEGMPQELVKKLVRRGSVIASGTKGQLLVHGVYPGGLWVQNLKSSNTTPNFFMFSAYPSIKSFTSRVAFEDNQFLENIDPSQYKVITDGKLLTEGDVFIDPIYRLKKKVLYTDKNNVYALVRSNETETPIIKSIPKNTITQGFSHVFRDLTSDEIKNIDIESSKSGKSSLNMSVFENSDSARVGDFFVYKDESGNKIIGKVTNTDAKKGIVIDNGKINAVTYERKDAKFYTNRDISGTYVYALSRVNNWKVSLLPEKEANQNRKRLIYVIPRGMDEEKLQLLQGNYASFGKYIDLGSQFSTEEYKDVTPRILQLMKERGDIVGDRLPYATIEPGTGKKYERDLVGILPMNYFSKLSPETKELLSPVQIGAFISSYISELQPDNNIYRIMNIVGDNVTAQLSTISETGKVITIQKEFSKSALLGPDNTVGSIAKLYLQYGNDKIENTLKIIKDNLSPEDAKNLVVNTKLKNNIIKSFTPFFKDLGVPIETTRQSFEDGQKAKIETKIDSNNDVSTKVLVNSSLGTAADVVHEVLHLFLMPLRYKSPEIYYDLIHSLNDEEINNEEDINLKEEMFVKKVAVSMCNSTDILDSAGEDINSESFIQNFKEAIKIINPNFTGEGISLSNPIELLKTPLYDVLGIQYDNSISHPMYNLGMLMGEPSMRRWMTENNITLKC